MKRDMDLVRLILLSAEESDGEFDALFLASANHSSDKIAFHVELMKAQGLLNATTSYAFGGTPVQVDIQGLTWDGYDYLDAIRSQQVWNRAKKAIAETVGDTSLSVVKDVCTALATSLVKANLGI